MTSNAISRKEALNIMNASIQNKKQKEQKNIEEILEKVFNHIQWAAKDGKGQVTVKECPYIKNYQKETYIRECVCSILENIYGYRACCWSKNTNIWVAWEYLE